MTDQKHERATRGERQKVALAAAHKHNGRWRNEGDEISVFPHTIERLRKAGKVRGAAGGSSKSGGQSPSMQGGS